MVQLEDHSPSFTFRGSHLYLAMYTILERGHSDSCPTPDKEPLYCCGFLVHLLARIVLSGSYILPASMVSSS